MRKINNTLRRLAIVDSGSARWTGGRTYTKMLTHSLGNACKAAGVELFLFCQDHNPDVDRQGLSAQVISLAPPRYIRGEQRIRQFLGCPKQSNLLSVAREHQISVLLPFSHVPLKSNGVKAIGWIPDFQHVYLPEYFSEAECRGRDKGFRELAKRATLVMLSSQNALEHYSDFAPEYAYKARLAPFPSSLAFNLPSGDVHASRRKFNLPEKFALVTNQFWQHKNHLVVVRALGQLRRRGIRIPVVMTGLTVDHREPDNQTFSRLLQLIATEGLCGQVIILGLIPFPDLVNLMRAATLVIQPSRFEGWSTVVQDVKALGRPLLCSDIPVHREQAPEALGFFPCDSDGTLADLVASCWESLEPGPNLVVERRALAAEREFAQRHGISLLRICQEACSI